MKKKYLSKKKILTFLGSIILYLFYGFINTISSDINFWKALSNLPIQIFNLLLLLLFVKIPFWIILIIALISFILFKLINRRLKEEKEYILSMIYDRELGLNTLFRGYKKKFPEKDSTISNTIAIIRKLEKLKLIELGCYSGGSQGIFEEHYKITKIGEKRRKKIKNITESEIENSVTEIFQKRDNNDEKFKDVEIPRSTNKTLAFNLKRLRQFKGLTQEELAKKVGLTKDTISKIELGKQENVGFKYLISICKELGIGIEELFIKNSKSSRGLRRFENKHPSVDTRLNRITKLMNAEQKIVEGRFTRFGKRYTLPGSQGNFYLYFVKKGSSTIRILYISRHFREFDYQDDLADIRVLMVSCVQQAGTSCKFIIATNDDLSAQRKSIMIIFRKMKNKLAINYRGLFDLEIWDDKALLAVEKILGLKVDL